MNGRFLSLATLVFCLIFATGGAPLGQEPKEDVKKKASIWMKTKLELSRNILQGLTEGDFAKVETSAQGLNVTTFLETLFRAKRPDYQQQVQLFTFANQELVRQAKAKNLSGMSLAYNHLTNSCVHCHQIVRDAK